MKKIILFLSLAAFTFTSKAQVKTPQPSPTSKIEQVVGLTDVTVEYSRPSAKGRKIYGDLVPFGKLWRTGANANTKITFSDDVKVGGQDLKAGTYAVFTTPNAGKWEVIFYTDSSNWGTPQKFDQSKVAAQITTSSSALPMPIETFTIMFNDFTSDSANIYFLWEKTIAAVKLEVPSKKQAFASIEKVLAGPTAGDYYQAAVFHKDNGDVNKAKEYIEKAISLRKQPAFWYHRQQSLIYAKAGDKKGAIKAAKTSLELAEKAGNADYVKLNKDSLKEWGA
ncbi:DUF2911 domain-containing protein [Aquimarina rhabdastrellae]